MNLRPFIKTHIKTMMTNFEVNRGPFDSFLREYYKNNKTLGPSEWSIIPKPHLISSEMMFCSLILQKMWIEM
ncbi:unnamed protein product [Paramecium octaurelia]|uniref:Uncharacterized protein n=1 Tax=Paramecium octaurelia TaxID=43137 RepID=A0A8S1TRX2_PAROT|nr:unnamed protein product [Paramecium octaurelia]